MSASVTQRELRRLPPDTMSERQQLLDALVRARVEMRERGERPPLPDPIARRRGGRLQRMACGIELRQREADGTIHDDEAEWLAVRREHLTEWQQQRARRTAIRLATAARTERAAVAVADARPAPRGRGALRAAPAEHWRGQLRGPDDLRALVTRLRGD